LMFHLLPYIEQGALYNKSREIAGIYAICVPEQGGDQLVKTFICPSDPSVGAAEQTPWGNPQHPNWGKGDACYAGNFQVFASGDFAGWLGKPNLKSTFQDGTSNTLLFVEKYAGCTSTRPNGNCWAWGGGGFISPVYGVPGTEGQKWQQQPSPWNSGACNPNLPSSSHTGGINAGLADGSVRYLNQGMAANTFWLATTPADGQPLPSDW